MALIASRPAAADDLAALVYCTGAAERAAERTDVDHPPGFRPGERVATRIASSAAGADYLPAGIHGNGPAARRGAQVDHPSGFRPGECMAFGIASNAADADDLAFSFTACFAEAAAEGAQVDHPSGFRPGECMAFGIASSAADADDLAFSFTARASLKLPPRVPRSIIPPSPSRKTHGSNRRR